MTTLVVVIIVGLLGTTILGYAAYWHWSSSTPIQRRTRPIPATAPVQPVVSTPPPQAPLNATARRRRWFRRPAVIITMVLLAIYGPITYFELQKYRPSVGSSLYQRLPRDVVLSIIADNESGHGTPGSGRQFNPDGSLVTNKNKDGTVDRGKWQINSRHDAEAKRRGIDITTEEGNRQFAIILYERNMLQDWESSRHRWEPKLLALGKTDTRIAVAEAAETSVVVVSKEWTDSIQVPYGYQIEWERTKIVAYESKDQDGLVRKYPRILTPLPPRYGSLESVRFRVTDEELDSVPVRLTFRKL